MNHNTVSNLKNPDEYIPTPKELEGDKLSYCYMQQDSWSFPEQVPFISKPEEPA